MTAKLRSDNFSKVSTKVVNAGEGFCQTCKYYVDLDISVFRASASSNASVVAPISRVW